MKKFCLLLTLAMVGFSTSCTRIPITSIVSDIISGVSSVQFAKKHKSKPLTVPTPQTSRFGKSIDKEEGTISYQDLSEFSFDENSFSIQIGTPLARPAWNRGCDWTGVGGQVFFDDAPVENVVLEAGGTLGGKNITGLSISGWDATYGPGGYEIKLADHTIGSSGSVWIQLKDVNGKPLSEKIFISTYDDCDKNLLLINFTQYDPSPGIVFYYPLFYK